MGQARSIEACRPIGQGPDRYIIHITGILVTQHRDKYKLFSIATFTECAHVTGACYSLWFDMSLVSTRVFKRM